MIGRMSFLTVPALHLPQIQLLHRFMHEKTKMLFPQHFPHIRRQQISLFRVVLIKIRHSAASCAKYTCAVKTGCHTNSEAYATENLSRQRIFREAPVHEVLAVARGYVG